MAFCWNAAIEGLNRDKLADGVELFPMTFPTDKGDPELCGGIWGFGIFDNGDEAKAAAAKEFIKFVCDDAEQGPQSVYATGFFPVRASFGDIYTGLRDRPVCRHREGISGYLCSLRAVSGRLLSGGPELEHPAL